MRIYFTGSHATGKTTLARYVSEHYHLPLLPEVARMILSEKELHLDSLRTNLNVVDDYQTQIFFKQIEQESKHENFVSDRSFDCLAYTAQHSRVFPTLMKSIELEKYIEFLKSPESIMFFVRPSKATVKEDGVREHLTWDGIIAVDAMIKLLFETFGLRYFQISTDNMQERVRLIDSVISLYNS